MDHSRKATYLFSIDALRVVAILAVIMIHVSTKTIATLKLNIEEVPFSLFLNQISRFAVPLFFLISGFVLELNNKGDFSYITFFKKRASRIIIPFVFWSLAYFLIGRNFDVNAVVSEKFMWTVILGTASYHLYFIPTLILFYLAFPFLHLIINVLKNPFVIGFIFITQGFFLYRDYYIKTWDIPYDFRIVLLSYSMFITGMVASHYKEAILSFVKKYYYLFFGLVVLLLLFIPFNVSDMTLKLKTSRFIYNQYGPLNYLFTFILAGFLFFLLEKTQFLKKWFMLLSKLSFFVFFIHVLIQTLVWNTFISPIIQKTGNAILKNVWFDPLFFFVVAALSFGIAYIIHKIPYASKITG